MLARPNIDQTNIILMLLSLGVAYVIPFELVLISYAFLGPAHYLTEISWLHDRSYFTGVKWIWAPFALLVAFIMAATWFHGLNSTSAFAAYAVLLALSIGFVAAKGWVMRVPIMLAIAFVLLMCRAMYPGFGLIVAMLLPTVIHIYVFTGLFILGGALKSKSPWGFASFVVFLGCGAFFYFVAPGITMISSDFVDKNLWFFDSLTDYIVQLVSMEGRVNSHAVLAFLSFAYTYHYLNWFSKTEVIKWHLIPKMRLYVIIALYLVAISVYMVDYSIGFYTLSFLSLVHVVLEFPLNAVSVRQIGASIFGRTKPA